MEKLRVDKLMDFKGNLRIRLSLIKPEEATFEQMIATQRINALVTKLENQLIKNDAKQTEIDGI